MKLHKLDSTGIAHYIVPILILVIVGISGTYVAAKSRSHADSLKTTLNTTAQNDNQLPSKATIYSLAAADGIATDAAVQAGTMPSNLPASAKTAEAADADGNRTDICHHWDYDAYSAHYNKCVDLRYSYTKNAFDDNRDVHTSAKWSFGSRFIVRMHSSCSGSVSTPDHTYGYTDLIFGVPNYGEHTWYSGGIDGSAYGNHDDWTKFSDSAQSFHMQFIAHYCEYRVRVWQ